MAQTRNPVTNLIGRARAIVRLELEGLDALPGGRLAVLGAVAVVVVAFSGLRLGYVDVYTESIPFMIAALALGMVGRAIGATLVAAHAVVDLLRSATGNALDPFATGLTGETLLGRAISWLLLWLLVVTIPTLGRMTREASRRDALRLHLPAAAASVAGALTAGALVFLWSAAEPYLIRPVFFLGGPTYAAMEPQRSGGILALAAAILFLVAEIAIHSRIWTGADLIPLVRRSASGVGAIVARVVGYVVAVVLVLGLVTSTLDIVLLAVGFIAAELLVAGVSVSPALRATITRLPFVARLGIALAGTFLFSQLVFAVWYQPLFGSEFFPLVLSLAVGIVLFRVLMEMPATGESSGSRASRGAVGTASMLLPLLVGAAWLAGPEVVRADNCSGLFDCEQTDLAKVSLAIGAIAAGLWMLLSQGWEKTPYSQPGPPAPQGPIDPFTKDLSEGFGIDPDKIQVDESGPLKKFHIRTRDDVPLPSRDTVEAGIEAGTVGEGTVTGADELLVGSVQEHGDTTRVVIREVNVETGEVGAAGKGTASGPNALQAAAAEAMGQLTAGRAGRN